MADAGYSIGDVFDYWYGGVKLFRGRVTGPLLSNRALYKIKVIRVTDSSLGLDSSRVMLWRYARVNAMSLPSPLELLAEESE